ncbi:hypothetical protein [Acinetobacter silvestris]|uniref:Spore coat protein U domain-containing protein n=1 Tax=Acinetobacter silvestris TaxID=1977882 RepID=A0A1Y3CND4_9GAMM|nr:hypothetical protein [Acinetobacter silvestris]OTG67393.1 hypothetical protein B9T28_01840 [Acinetobacter silvestris]
MKLKLSICVLLLFCIPLGHAKSCQIDRVTSSQLKLSSSYLSQAATSFMVSCDTRYAIQFSSRNLTNSSGSSYLVNETNHKLRTQMNISGASGSRWNVPLSQPAGTNDKFVVLVQLLERPNVLTPAGSYKDNLYVSLMF